MAISMVFIAFLIAISMSKSPMTEAGASGFSIDLIHRDSPQSPSYDSSLAPLQRSINSLRRSFNRLNHFTAHNSTQSTAANIIFRNGEYLIKFYVGTPPVPTLAIFDTGSDLVWIQCHPCIECFKQKYPIFNPRNSSTYRKLSCSSSACKAYQETTCGKKSKTCSYSQFYGDGSFSNGTLVTETFTLGRNVSFPNAVIGCGNKNDGIFNAGESGIAGFGSGKVSLISQLGSSVQWRFSYCLVSNSSETSHSGKLNLGKKAAVSGPRAVSTPMIFKSDGTNFYYLTLEGISVGNQRLDFDYPSIRSNATEDSKEGNMIIDSGTTMTFLHTDLYHKLLKALERKIKLRRDKDPLIILDLCYHSKNPIKAPVITVHFKGADLKLNSENTFLEFKKNVYCLAFGPAVDVGLYGNMAQRNFVVGYDLIKKTISFRPTDCSKS